MEYSSGAGCGDRNRQYDEAFRAERPTRKSKNVPSAGGSQGKIHSRPRLLKASGALKAVRDRNHLSITIETATGQRFKLYEFMDAVLGYWRKFLLAEGVPIRGQSATQLYGAEAQRLRSLRGSAKV